MPKSLMTVNQVAASLHVSTREVIRMAEQKILPAMLVRGRWQFRAGEILNWIGENLHTLPQRRAKDRHPVLAQDMLIAPGLLTTAIALDVPAKTKASALRELAALCTRVDSTLDTAALLEGLQAREAIATTALQDGVAVPHPARPLYSSGPVLAAIRTAEPIIFGQRDGGLTDLFFLICCPTPTEHLLYLGRLCRLLIEKDLQLKLRSATGPMPFHRAIEQAERALCQSGSPGA